MADKCFSEKSEINTPQATNNHQHQGHQHMFRTLARMSSYPITKSESQWRAILSPEQFAILRQKATERPDTNKQLAGATAGVYSCAGCDTPLYKSSTKFDTHCGWPAFYEAIPGSVKLFEDTTHGMTRTEMVCSQCGGHLGHVFRGEGYDTPTDERHCVNSISLKFNKE